jgi:hypothetical protein
MKLKVIALELSALFIMFKNLRVSLASNKIAHSLDSHLHLLTYN